ncbi:MAG: radical SAM family heme chaperone HemW [Anaerolineae bacterium]|jgi:oxygen-independent coproporphyrinogen III oxidase|nr:radical SAM family heme chaperone HemW [Anaerolineae bacterium]MBT7189435.1 radical SAM family heme chaperone HemW [Anaerolineae bacterium]MBT7988516.1 radical SAM family heme chaperone HemW [Anaerolineae bacterium]
MKPSYALYFHIPFCRHRCAYCDFTTYAGQDALIPAYVDALINEIAFVGGNLTEKAYAKSIFFGGGTPSLMSVPQYASIFVAIQENFHIHPDAEISLEVNPGTLSPNYFEGLREVGFNRISFGVQSAHSDELKMLERIHTYEDVLSANLSARKAGFENLSFDLIFGLPEQTLEKWQATVKLIVDLAPEHLSLYALTIEDGTPFGRWAERGMIPLPDPDLAAEMYEWASGYLEAQGFEQYEISNWARNPRSKGFSPYKCQHNLQYWRNLPYLGFGTGAHGYAAGMRYANTSSIQKYIKCLHSDSATKDFPLSPATRSADEIVPTTEMNETMMLGLRLTQEGVSKSTFRARFGVGLEDVFAKEIDELMKYGLLEWGQKEISEVSKTSDILRLTKKARLLGNQVFRRFVS